MGLDMYLYGKKYIGASNGKDERFPLIWEVREILYWRKCNAIHGWFIRNVQNGVDDCGYYNVDMYKLEELSELCSDIIEGRKDPSDLPTMSGFFFGSDEYDEAYLDDLRRTIEQIDHLSTNDMCGFDSFEYHASW